MIIPIGNTVLITTKKENENITLVDGIYIPTEKNNLKTIHYIGNIASYGTLVTDETKNILPIGTKVLFDWKKKSGTKLQIDNKLLYIKDVNDILGVIE
jgi:co-chaperonin GroES (HSP10)